jgi:hypothetical protein
MEGTVLRPGGRLGIAGFLRGRGKHEKAPLLDVLAKLGREGDFRMSAAAVRVEKSRPMISGLTVVDLLDRCTKRPVDPVAWQEFVRRFHWTIQSFVCRVVRLRTEDEPEAKYMPDARLIGELVDDVYRMLVENHFEALRLLDRDNLKSFDNYLLIVSIKVVRDYFRQKR